MDRLESSRQEKTKLDDDVKRLRAMQFKHGMLHHRILGYDTLDLTTMYTVKLIYKRDGRIKSKELFRSLREVDLIRQLRQLASDAENMASILESKLLEGENEL